MTTKLTKYSDFISCMSNQLIMESDWFNPKDFHISALRMKVVENIQDIISKNPDNVEFIERLLWVKDIIWPDGTLIKDIGLHCLLGKAFDDFKELEKAMDEEIDRRLLLLNPIREEIIKRLHNISPDDSSDKAFLRRILDWILCANILHNKLIENLIIIIESLWINDLDDIIMLKWILEYSQPVNLKLVCNNLLNKSKRQDSIPENIAILKRLRLILKKTNPENLRIIIEISQIKDFNTLLKLTDILIKANPENLKFFISIFWILDKKMLFMLKAILKEWNPEILKQKLRDSASWSDFLWDLSEG